MALSNLKVVGDGTTNSFPIPFKYLNREHVDISIDGAVLPRDAWTWTTADTIEIGTAPAFGAKIAIYRVTPPDEPLVDYKTQTAALKGRDLDLTYLHALYMLQERVDQYENTLRLPLGDAADSFAEADERARGVMVFDGAGRPAAVQIDDLPGFSQPSLNFRSWRPTGPIIDLGNRADATDTFDLGVRP